VLVAPVVEIAVLAVEIVAPVVETAALAVEIAAPVVGVVAQVAVAVTQMLPILLQIWAMKGVGDHAKNAQWMILSRRLSILRVLQK
jgi:hypothetical protein